MNLTPIGYKAKSKLLKDYRIWNVKSIEFLREQNTLKIR